MAIVVEAEHGRRDRRGVARPLRRRTLAGDDQGGTRFRRPLPAQRDAHPGRAVAQSTAGSHRPQVRGIGHLAKRNAMPDSPHTAPERQRRIEARPVGRRLVVVGIVLG